MEDNTRKSMNKLIVDISFYDDNDETPQGIDFAKMFVNADGVIIRAGQNTWLDPDIKRNWADAKGVIPRGSYWFYDDRVEPQRQAEKWAEALDGDFGELPLCADFELNYGGSYQGWKRWSGFLEYVKLLMPEKAEHIMIYTGWYYWRDNAPNVTAQKAELDYFKQYPLWIARYGVEHPLKNSKGEDMPLYPWGMDSTLWQFTDTGSDELGRGADFGLERKGADLSWFMGDAKRWSWFTGGTEPVIIEDDPVEQKTGKVLMDGLNVRGSDDMNSLPIGRLREGVSVKAEETKVIAGEKVVKIAAWVRETYNGQTLISFDEHPEEPPVIEELPEPEQEFWRVLHDFELKAKGIQIIESRFKVNDPEVFLLKDEKGKHDESNPRDVFCPASSRCI